MKYLILFAILLTGCTTKADNALEVKRGELRHKIFVECMELAAKNTRKGDDDVSDIVSACSNQGWYMANQMIND